MHPPETAPMRVHGTLVEVVGVGVLLLGRSGIGKSECAVELVVRGYRVIADDVVLIAPDAEGKPVGFSPELIRHYLELRGIGIVHVPSLFGERAVGERSPVDLVLQLESWGSGDVDRVGLDPQTRMVGEFEIATLLLPVAPGRNVATLVEVAARNFLHQKEGRSGARDLDQRVRESLRRQEN